MTDVRVECEINIYEFLENIDELDAISYFTEHLATIDLEEQDGYLLDMIANLIEYKDKEIVREFKEDIDKVFEEYFNG